MAGKRLAALLGALLLVVAAVGVRRWIDSGGEVSLGGSPSSVYCDPLMAEACLAAFDGREIIVESPGVTLDRLVETRDDQSLLWVTADVWIEILRSERSRLGRSALVESVETDIAHAEVVVVGDDDLTDACGQTVLWSCLADPSSELDIGFDSRATTVGLASQGHLVAGFMGSPTFATNDLGSSYGQWRARIGPDLTELSPSRSALDEMLTVRGRFDVVSAAEPEWDRLARDGFVVGVPPDSGPAMTAAVASLGGAGGSTDGLRGGLIELGWQAGPAPDRVGAAAGVLESIRNE